MSFLYKMLLLTISKLIRHSQKQPKNVAGSLNEQIWNLALFLLQNLTGMLLPTPSFLGHKSQISVSLLIFYCPRVALWEERSSPPCCHLAGTLLPLHCSFSVAWGAGACGRESCKGKVCADQSWLPDVFGDH